MNRKRWCLVLVVAVCLVLGSWAAVASMAESDAVKVAPGNFKVLLENERVRVLDYTAKKGEKVALHSHPANVVYAITGGETKFTMPDGSTKQLKVKAGEAVWSDGGPHSSESITDMHVIQIELKK